MGEKRSVKVGGVWDSENSRMFQAQLAKRCSKRDKVKRVGGWSAGIANGEG